MRLLLLPLVILHVNFGFSQTEVAPPPNVELPPPDLSMPIDRSFTFDGNPEASFPGGVQALKKYIAKNFPIDSIPEEILENGRVYLQFVVCYSGEIEDVRIARGLNKETDAVCLEFIKNMPNWIPVQDKTGPIDVKVTFPITISLD
jgi:protein TonB